MAQTLPVLSTPLPLSTPDTHIFEDPTPSSPPEHTPEYTDAELKSVFEIERTAAELQQGKWRTIALQFPDDMLRDATRVYEALEKRLLAEDTQHDKEPYRLCILADTSYGACCVDEIAAEHIDAQIVVHYGRSCLSPTARLPVIYVFTSRPLSHDEVIAAFEAVYRDKLATIILMADIEYHSHVIDIKSILKDHGYTHIIAPDVIHDPKSVIPNRKVDSLIDVAQSALFHISDPPRSLLFMLSSKVKEMYIYPTTSAGNSQAFKSETVRALRRRYGTLTSLSTCAVWGILINTLSVKNYLDSVSGIKAQIAAAGKKSYTFVVGKVNAAKIANFSEVGGWVVVGCWESGLIESDEFFRPLITPFELGLALMSDDERVWSGVWRAGIEDFGGLRAIEGEVKVKESVEQQFQHKQTQDQKQDDDINSDTESESEPPEFDLRTGRYISHTRPMRLRHSQSQEQQPLAPASVSTTRSTPAFDPNLVAHTTLDNEPLPQTLARRMKAELTTVNGSVSPGAEYLRNQRTWQGLGSDFEAMENGAPVEEGRTGVASGYRVGEQRNGDEDDNKT